MLVPSGTSDSTPHAPVVEVERCKLLKWISSLGNSARYYVRCNHRCHLIGKV
jgi:hypothetical protein